MCSRNGEKLQRAANEIRQRYAAQVIAEPVDVTDGAAVKAFVEHVAATYGSVDVCVANAGGPPAKMFLETTDDEWQRAYATNFMSIVSLAHAVIPWMQRGKWGRIVTITSVSVRQPVSAQVYTNAVRAGVLGLVKSLSNEFGQDGITVNNVGPGFTATARLKELAKKRGESTGSNEAEFITRLGTEAALKRVGLPEEVADAIVWLASDRAAYITGQTLLVDGGLYKGL